MRPDFDIVVRWMAQTDRQPADFDAVCRWMAKGHDPEPKKITIVQWPEVRK